MFPKEVTSDCIILLSEKVTSCVEPVSMSQNGLRFNVPLGTEMSGSFRIGSKVIYDCLPGYILHGEAVLTCSKSGCWEPNALPKCLPQAQLLPTCKYDHELCL